MAIVDGYDMRQVKQLVPEPPTLADLQETVKEPWNVGAKPLLEEWLDLKKATDMEARLQMLGNTAARLACLQGIS